MPIGFTRSAPTSHDCGSIVGACWRGRLSCARLMRHVPIVLTSLLVRPIATDYRQRGHGGPQTRTGLSRPSNRSLFAAPIPAGKRFGEARDRAAIFAADGPFRATETGALSRFRSKPREVEDISTGAQETGFAQDCVVADALHRDQSPNPNSLLTGKLTGNFSILGAFGQFSLLIVEQIQVVTIKIRKRGKTRGR